MGQQNAPSKPEPPQLAPGFMRDMVARRIVTLEADIANDELTIRELTPVVESIVTAGMTDAEKTVAECKLRLQASRLRLAVLRKEWDQSSRAVEGASA